jgi:hypothetical protein
MQLDMTHCTTEARWAVLAEAMLAGNAQRVPERGWHGT